MGINRLASLAHKAEGQPALVMGNGPSRRIVDAGDFRLVAPKGVIIGCNAIIREFDPDYLVALDAPICEEIAQLPHVWHVITKAHGWPVERDARVIFADGAETKDCSSGNLAYFTAIVLGCDPIILAGFDGTANNGNVFAGTPGYVDPDHFDHYEQYERKLWATAHDYGAVSKTWLVWPPYTKHALDFRRVTWSEAVIQLRAERVGSRT